MVFRLQCWFVPLCLPFFPISYPKVDEETLDPDSSQYQLAAVTVGCQQKGSHALLNSCV